MSVVVQLRPETERRLLERAAWHGINLADFLQLLAERECDNGVPGEVGRPAPTFEETTAPFAKAVEASGMTEEELGDFFSGVVKDLRAARRTQPGNAS